VQRQFYKTLGVEPVPARVFLYLRLDDLPPQLLHLSELPSSSRYISTAGPIPVPGPGDPCSNENFPGYSAQGIRAKLSMNLGFFAPEDLERPPQTRAIP
jgi:hypothetical protein